MTDPYNLQRFLDAQAATIDQARTELRHGGKTSHWMWFIFPQIAGLAHSATSRRFAIASRAEAAAYWAHPVLGPRLAECTGLALAIERRAVADIFPPPDDAKFRSCLTVFAEVADDDAPFRPALEKFFAGVGDPRTRAALQAGPCTSL